MYILYFGTYVVQYCMYSTVLSLVDGWYRSCNPYGCMGRASP